MRMQQNKDGMNSVRMMKWGGIIAALFVIALLFAFPLTVSAASTHAVVSNAGGGRIYGQLRDGTKHDAPVVGQSVTLQVAQGSNTGDLATVTTDARGMFSFGNLVTDKTYSYAVYTLYQKAQYVTDLIDLSSKPVQQVNLTVYDATTSTARIAIAQANILIDNADARHGLLTITESYVFENLGLTTYVGSFSSGKQKPNALLFSLPSGAQHVSLKTGFDGYQQVQVNDGFATDAAVPPGLSQFAFSFQVSYSSTHYDFAYAILYPTVAFSVLLPLSYHASSGILVSQGTVNTDGQTYQQLAAQQIRANAQVHVELDGLPSPATAASAAGSGLNLTWLLLIGLAMLAIVGITWYMAARARCRAASMRKSAQTVRAAVARKDHAARARAQKSGKAGKAGKEAREVQAAKAQREPGEAQVLQEKLLAELLALDKAYEAGTMKKAAYEESRAKLKARLRAVMSAEQDKKAVL